MPSSRSQVKTWKEGQPWETIFNIKRCCVCCNSIKGERTLAELLSWLKLVCETWPGDPYEYLPRNATADVHPRRELYKPAHDQPGHGVGRAADKVGGATEATYTTCTLLQGLGFQVQRAACMHHMNPASGFRVPRACTT